MKIKLNKSYLNTANHIKITGSKSESNRLLLLQALYPEIKIENLSNSDDSVLMQNALQSSSCLKDIHHAGTAMRFLTAYYAMQNKSDIEITGSARMQERPIKILVDALKMLGADISYKGKHGYPPLHIKGKQIAFNKVELEASVSSQYISALLLIAPKLQNGLELTLKGQITSLPYIKMTLALLSQIGVTTSFETNKIEVKPLEKCSKEHNFTVESDWSSASYYYSIIALSDIGTTLQLSAYKKNSLQGDAVLIDLYKNFGVDTAFSGNTITLTKQFSAENNMRYEVNLANAPDLAQTIAITCFGLGIPFKLTGLHTLKIKETDRLSALKAEIEKFGTKVNITKDSLWVNTIKPFNAGVSVDTYNDHRMAMAFAPLALKTSFYINNPNVVSKSYPEFWTHLQQIGFQIKKY
jgi:3-phosphoshikimate 1-carboxyvinyltransferase